MFDFLSNIPIARRIFIAFTLATAIAGAVIVLLGSYDINSLNVRDQAVRTSFEAQNLAAQENTNLQRMNALLQTFHTQVFASLSGVVRDPSLSASGALIYSDILAREVDFDQSLATYQSNYELATSSNMSTIHSILLSDNPNSTISSDQKAALDAVVNQDWPQYKQLQDPVLGQLERLETDVQSGKIFTQPQVTQFYEQTYLMIFNANNAFLKLKNDWQRVVDIAVSMGETVTAVGPSQTQPILISTTIAFFCTILVMLATGYLVNLTITRPLRYLATLTRRIVKGDTYARARVLGRDEINFVAQSMNTMLDKIVQLIQEAQSRADALQAQVEKLVSEVSGIGEGDLRIQAEVTVGPLGVLADSFNYMVEELTNLVVRVKNASYEVEHSTVMTFDRMVQLVENADHQINQIVEATAEVEQMAESSRQVAERAQVLSDIARDARRTAQDGRDAVQQTSEGIEHIQENVQNTAKKVQVLGERSREINNIVEVITTIAHQTNRLALDAAIQAAMAGENGKGFGAVAADIRRLAERAKEQAGMITHIVRGVREDIAAVAVSMQDTERETSMGARLAQEVGTSLGSIFAVVERQAQEIETINRMTAHQLESSQTVERIMQAVSTSTQHSSASIREVSQHMERLTRLAEQLRASVEAFKLAENRMFYDPSLQLAPREEQNDNMTISGVFRAVTASPQGWGTGRPALAVPAASNGPTTSGPAARSLYPTTPYQQPNGQGGPSWPGGQQEYQRQNDGRNN